VQVITFLPDLVVLVDWAGVVFAAFAAWEQMVSLSSQRSNNRTYHLLARQSKTCF
jgi:hypothetical protein